MSSRVPNSAPIGSLLKRPHQYDTKIKDTFRSPREHDEKHLTAIRQCPCVKCGSVPSEAAHVRMSSAAHGKRSGLGEKPSDCWTVPLCSDHHKEQHRKGELTFWWDLDISPVLLAHKLYAVSPDVEKMTAIIQNVG